MAPAHSNNRSRNGRLPMYLTAVLIIAMIATGILIPAARAFFGNAWDVLSSGNQDPIYEWVGTFGAYGPLIIIASMIVQMFLLVIPTVLLMVVAILAYGPVWGSLIALIAGGCCLHRRVCPGTLSGKERPLAAYRRRNGQNTRIIH